MDAYGPITQHLWFGDGYLLVGFKSGQVVVVSSRGCVAAPQQAGGTPLLALSTHAASGK
jgi:WD repeat-containing protein 19